MNITEKEAKEFVAKYKNIDLDEHEDSLTTWEGNITDQMLSPLVMRRYCTFLRYWNVAQWLVLFICLLVLSGLLVKFLFFQGYEMYLFIDGTDLTCIMNPKTGVITQNGK